jgi:hypothetical protein
LLPSHGHPGAIKRQCNVWHPFWWHPFCF